MAGELGPVAPEAEDRIRRELIDVLGIADPTEIMVFSKRVASHAVDSNNLVLRYSKLWGTALDMDERRTLAEMIERTAASAGPISPAHKVTIHKLRERLGLTP